ncbi:MAG: hypothetical protein L3K07_04140 [Thermoplasmata archaeon]|nr:hypothetical protein [Thermoplasmata archaeon]
MDSRPSGFSYDLSELIPERARSGRGTPTAFLVVAVTGAVAIIVGIVEAALRGVSPLSVAVVVVGLGFLIVGSAVIGLAGTWIRSIQADDTGMAFTLTNGKTRTIRWHDPGILLYLWDRSGCDAHSAGRRGRASPYSIASAANIGAPGVIPKELYDRLLPLFRAQGLAIRSAVVSGGEDSGAVRNIIAPGPTEQ